MKIVELDEVKRQIGELLKLDFVRPSISPWRAQMILRGKNDRTQRLCIHYRGLNVVTVKNKYPLSRITDLFNQLRGANIFLRIDLCSKFHQESE